MSGRVALLDGRVVDQAFAESAMRCPGSYSEPGGSSKSAEPRPAGNEAERMPDRIGVSRPHTAASDNLIKVAR
jgi:hypothetical protein